MILTAVVDDGMGMLFNGRRQSRDRILRQRILELAGDSTLWMNEYSYGLFRDECENARIRVDGDFLMKAGEGEVCFNETEPMLPVEERMEKLVLFRWNRMYPADVRFDLVLNSGVWRMESSEDFAGSSHERITMEVYVRD